MSHPTCILADVIDCWGQLTERVTVALGDLRIGQFLVAEYLIEGSHLSAPYAQTARDSDGWYCEIVSAHYLPASAWPLDELHLRRAGWTPPDADTFNWWTVSPDETAAAEDLILGLRDARGCHDPRRYMWSAGTFPGGPQGGKPIPEPAREPARQLLAA